MSIGIEEIKSLVFAICCRGEIGGSAVAFPLLRSNLNPSCRPTFPRSTFIHRGKQDIYALVGRNSTIFKSAKQYRPRQLIFRDLACKLFAFCHPGATTFLTFKCARNKQELIACKVKEVLKLQISIIRRCVLPSLGTSRLPPLVREQKAASNTLTNSSASPSHQHTKTK